MLGYSLYLNIRLGISIGLIWPGFRLRAVGHKSSAVYDINYHLVWCPKYRKPILEKPTVKEFQEDQIATIAETKEYEVLALEVMPDHVHLFVSARARVRY